MMRTEVTIGGVLGLILGGLVTFVIAQSPEAPVAEAAPLVPVQRIEASSFHEASPTASSVHRPVRPGSGRAAGLSGPTQS